MSRKIRCPKCNGKGKVIDKLLAAVSFGTSLLYDNGDTCPRCKGKGWVIVHYDYLK